METTETASPELSVADKLDNEIANLRAQVQSLKQELNLRTATALTVDSTRELLRREGSKKSSRSKASADSLETKLLAKSDEQAAHKQQCLYRACASVTCLKIRDPDPNAVDGGNVLGLRFEVMSKSQFLRPYYVMLNRPYPNSRHLRIHRHTVPPSIPLAGLAARHLPPPKPRDDEEENTHKQDLPRFARALRRELVRYHNRVGVIGDMKKAAGLGTSKDAASSPGAAILDISPADATAKQIRVEWNDGRTGRLIMDDNGEIVKMVAHGENGRDRKIVRDFIGSSLRIEELTKRLEGT